MTISIAEKLAETYAEHLKQTGVHPCNEPHVSVILAELQPMMEDIEAESISDYIDEQQYPNEGYYNHDAHWPSSYRVG